MISARLLTRDGELVALFKMPPFLLLPEVAIWGSRVFVLRKEPEAHEQPQYYEACAWSVDASKAFEELEAKRP